jgi:hypothetical protein
MSALFVWLPEHRAEQCNPHGKMQAGGFVRQAVALVVKRYAEAVGLNAELYTGHSPRETRCYSGYCLAIRPQPQCAGGQRVQER